MFYSIKVQSRILGDYVTTVTQQELHAIANALRIVAEKLTIYDTSGKQIAYYEKAD